jgi:hypothetical protein
LTNEQKEFLKMNPLRNSEELWFFKRAAATTTTRILRICLQQDLELFLAPEEVSRT